MEGRYCLAPRKLCFVAEPVNIKDISVVADCERDALVRKFSLSNPTLRGLKCEERTLSEKDLDVELART
jgi:hypothetical protein